MFHPLLVHSECCWCPDQRYRAATFVSSSEVQHASMAGQSGHARNCQVILLNAWPPLPHYGNCDIEALWHEPRFQRVAFWHRAALAIMLAQPSSAPIERVFSALLKTVHVVGDNQGRGLSDYQSESMMIYYNSRERARP